MKKLHFIAAMLLCQLLGAQNWTNLPGTWYYPISNFYEDTINNRLLAFGGFDSVGTVQAQGIAAWDGENWSRLPNWPTYSTSHGIGVNSLIRYNGDLYMGCSCPTWGSHGYLARYNGLTLDTIAKFAIGVPGTLLEYQNSLIVCTHWSNDSVNGIPFGAVAKWDGTNWMDISQGVFDGAIFDGVVYHGEVYVSGFSAIDQQPHVFKYSNGSWQVGQQFSGIVFHFSIYNDELYAGSYNNQSSWGNAIMRLDTLTNTWKIPGGGLASTSIASWPQVDGMTVSNGALYVVGVFDHAGGVPAAFVTKWDGTQWCGLGVDLNTYQCRTIGTFRDTIYVSTGIIFDNDSSDNFVKWNGGNYTDTCGFLTTGIHESTIESSINVFPNPATDIVTFQTSSIPGNKTLQIFDSFGKEIWRKETAEQEVVFSANGFAPGIYFYRIVQDGETTTSGKFIIRR